VRIKAGDAHGIENLAQYIIRNTFSQAKLSFVEKTGTVIYRTKMSHSGNKKNFQTLSALELIIEPYDDGWPEHEEPFIDVQTL
jgi:hypothetical protein